MLLKKIEKILQILLIQCNVGCGQGQSTRIVRCKRGNTIVNDSKCNPYTKPIRSQMCETRTHCSWKAKKWKNV